MGLHPSYHILYISKPAKHGLVVWLVSRAYPRDPSMRIIFTLGFNVYKDYLHWGIWALGLGFGGLGLTVWGFRVYRSGR